MAKYKHYDYSQMKLLPVSFKEQILPGTFEHTLNELIDHEVDLTVFAERYRNDETGAPAYDPAILLKIILYAYSRGITQSREIARLCRENIVFMALSADTTPHFTTIADFIATLEREIVSVYLDVLLICDEAGLIGREMFAVDGVKLPSNASKEWSGTRADFEQKAQKMERAIKHLVKRHRAADVSDEDPSLRAARAKQIKTLKASVAKVKGFLRERKDRTGSSGRVVKSNITDNESAKIKTGKGVIQGYDAMAVVDAKHQVIVQAHAFGAAQEHALLVPMLEHTRESFRRMGTPEDVLKRAAVLADSGMHSEANLEYLFTNGVDAYVADTLFRKRDPRFASAERHRPTRPDEPWARPKPRGLFTPKDFQLDGQHRFCICPAGKRLYRNGANVCIRGNVGVKFRGAKRDCISCALRQQCLRNPGSTPVRQVVFFMGREQRRESYTSLMKRKIDTEQGRYRYSRRLGIVEPVFANITSAHRLRRFSLRGRVKVDTQWQLFCLVHNIGKIQRYGKRRRGRGSTH
jgi:transposase